MFSFIFWSHYSRVLHSARFSSFLHPSQELEYEREEDLRLGGEDVVVLGDQDGHHAQQLRRDRVVRTVLAGVATRGLREGGNEREISRRLQDARKEQKRSRKTAIKIEIFLK